MFWHNLVHKTNLQQSIIIPSHLQFLSKFELSKALLEFFIQFSLFALIAFPQTFQKIKTQSRQQNKKLE